MIADDANLPAGAAPPLLGETLRALCEPRCGVPLALVAVALLAAEWVATRSLAALGLDLALFLAFCACSPALWRALCAAPPGPRASRLGGWALYVAASAAIVGLVAVALPPAVGRSGTWVMDPHALGVLGVLFVVGGWGLGRDIELARGAARERARAERLAAEAAHAQLLALRAQLDPHFLFNTLNAIAEWCREDAVVAERATLALARILRALFDALRTPRWSVGDEAALLGQLAELYAARDAARYRFRVEVAAAAAGVALPSLVLLPLFENAIKHGPSAGHEGLVSLVVGEGDAPGAVRVEIRNPGAYRGRRADGHGLPTVERRLALEYGGRARLAIASCGPRETVVTVALPAPDAGEETPA